MFISRGIFHTVLAFTSSSCFFFFLPLNREAFLHIFFHMLLLFLHPFPPPPPFTPPTLYASIPLTVTSDEAIRVKLKNSPELSNWVTNLSGISVKLLKFTFYLLKWEGGGGLVLKSSSKRREGGLTPRVFSINKNSPKANAIHTKIWWHYTTTKGRKKRSKDISSAKKRKNKKKFKLKKKLTVSYNNNSTGKKS